MYSALVVHFVVFLMYIAPIPSISFNPSNRIQGAMVGDPLTIQCIVNTVPEVSTMNISWTGSGGPIMSNTRMTISPITVNGNTYTSNLQFTYLMEGDEDTYTCNVMILETSGSQSVEL